MSLREIHRRPGFWPWVIAILIFAALGANQQRITDNIQADRVAARDNIVAELRRDDEAARAAFVTSCDRQNQNRRADRRTFAETADLLGLLVGDNADGERLVTFLRRVADPKTGNYPPVSCTYPPPDPAPKEGN